MPGMTAEPGSTDEESGSRSEAGAYGDYLDEREEVLRHKWVMSERVGHDTGFEAALTDWAHHHHTLWRRQRAKRNE
jgi:hypothetical protein